MKSKLIEKINRSACCVAVLYLTFLRYTSIIKMETFHRDSLSLKNKLNLNINVDFTRREGKEGHTTVDRYQRIFGH